jgi:hypothetical protein
MPIDPNPRNGPDAWRQQPNITNMKTLAILSAFAGFLCAAHGADYSIPWSTVDGGGGTSTSADGRFSVSGTAGQPDAGTLASNDGRFRLSGGFWQAEVVFCGCTLGIGVSGGNFVVSWPCELSGCILEYADELLGPPSVTVWHPVSPQPIGHNFVAPLTGTQRYFRLRSP